MRIVLTWLRLEMRRRWRSLLVLALLVALATATVLAAAAGARRGQTAFDRLWAQTLPATVTVLPNQPGFDWAKIRALPEVAAAQRVPGDVRVRADLLPGRRAPCSRPSATEMARTIERPVMLAGRMFNPARADEVIVTPQFAARYHKAVGDTLTLDLASLAAGQPRATTAPPGRPPGLVSRPGSWGSAAAPWLSLDADAPGQTGGVLASPALYARYQANILGTNTSRSSTR